MVKVCAKDTETTTVCHVIVGKGLADPMLLQALVGLGILNFIKEIKFSMLLSSQDECSLTSQSKPQPFPVEGSLPILLVPTWSLCFLLLSIILLSAKLWACNISISLYLLKSTAGVVMSGTLLSKGWHVSPGNRWLQVLFLFTLTSVPAPTI